MVIDLDPTSQSRRLGLVPIVVEQISSAITRERDEVGIQLVAVDSPSFHDV